MSKIFDLHELTDYELYHLRYGKGAVIIALEKEDCEKNESEWNMKEQELLEEARNKIKPIKQEISELKNELRHLTGPIRKMNQPPSDEDVSIKNRIELLEQEQKSLHYVIKEYRSNIQLAMFYTHNVSSQSNVHTRFDKVISIEETDSHVILLLKFNDSLQETHEYHQKILRSKPNCSFNKTQRSGNISGVVKRVIPIASVSLEVIFRHEQKNKT